MLFCFSLQVNLAFVSASKRMVCLTRHCERDLDCEGNFGTRVDREECVFMSPVCEGGGNLPQIARLEVPVIRGPVR